MGFRSRGEVNPRNSFRDALLETIQAPSARVQVSPSSPKWPPGQTAPTPPSTASLRPETHALRRRRLV